MIHSSNMCLVMLCPKQERMALPEVMSVTSAVLVFIGEFKGEPVVVVVVVVVKFAAGLHGSTLGKHPGLPKAGPVKCWPADVLAADEAASHGQ